MKKYSIIMAIALLFGVSNLWAADFGDLLTRLDSRDFSAEKDVVTGLGGVYVGELVNPHSETPMFKARDEFRAQLFEAQKTGDTAKIDELCAFIADSVQADVSVETKVWLLEQLAVIGTEKDVAGVAALLKSDQIRVVDAAAACLAKIPGDAALGALKENQTIPAAAAALTCRLAPIIPQQGLESDMPLSISNASNEDVSAWLEKYDELDDWTKEQTLAGLTARDDKSYRDYALQALKSDSADLQKAGFVALEKMAIQDDVDVFVDWLQKDRDLAIRLAGYVVSEGFDEALLARFDQATDAQQFNDLATILANRAVDVRPRIFKKTTAAECADRLTLLEKVCAISTADDMPQLVATVVRFPRGKEHDAAENLVAALCNKDASPIIALKGQYPEAVLYPIIARTGGDAAKAEIAAALDSTDAAVRAAGLAALNVWADAQFADKMESLLASDSLTEGQKIAVLRAFIRVISLPDDQIGIEISRDEKLAKLKQAYNNARRVDEKRLILSRLAANRTDKSFEFAIECADQPDVADAAYEAIVAHAHDTAIRKQFPELTAKGLAIVIEKSQNQELVERAKTYKGRME